MTEITERTHGRFWPKVDKSGECWEWTASQFHGGYGQFRHGGTQVLAHRMSWTMANGEIPDGLCVCHKCDNRKCVSPDHLFLGTARDNVRDMHAKGRNPDRKGARHPMAKLCDSDIAEIRRLCASGMNQYEVAKDFGIVQSHVSNICSGAKWRVAS